MSTKIVTILLILMVLHSFSRYGVETLNQKFLLYLDINIAGTDWLQKVGAKSSWEIDKSHLIINEISEF